MNNWQFVNIVISLMTASSSFYIAYYAWRNQNVQGARWFSAAAAATGWVSFWYGFEAYAGNNLNAYISFSKIEYIGLTFIPLLWLGLALRFNGRLRPLDTRWTVALSIIPIITVVLAWTNEFHGMIWAEPAFDTSAFPPIFTAEYGLGFWVYIIYSYVIFLAGSVILVRTGLRSWQIYRTQSILILVGTGLPWIGNLSEIFDFAPVPGLYLNAIYLGVCMLCIAFAMFRFQLLDIMPLAHDVILQNIPTGVVVVDMQHKVVALNKAVQTYLEIAQKEPIGQPLENLFPRFAAEINAVRDVLDKSFELKFDERTIEITISPVHDHQKNLRGRLFVFRDVTLRAQAEKAIREQQAFAEALLQIGNQLNSALNTDKVMNLIVENVGRVLPHDHADIIMLGRIDYLADPLLSRSIDSAFIVSDTAQYRGWHTVHSDQTMRSYACAPINVDGKLVGFLRLSSKTPGAFTGRSANQLQVFADQAALGIKNAWLMDEVMAHAENMELLYNRVSYLEQLKGDMIRIAAHDLKNPLGVVKGYLSLMNELNDLTSAEIRHYLEPMTRSANRMNQIITDILSLERIEKMAAMPMQIFNLTETAQEAINEFKGQTRQQFEIQLPDNLTIVKGDAAQIREVITNFISNAIKYTPESGRISVNLTSNSETARLEVRDTGYGIPDHMQKELFKPFYRAQTPETKNIEGTGLGLHLVKNIVERHDGEIIFHSVYGQGSTFGFELPLLKQQPDNPSLN